MKKDITEFKSPEDILDFAIEKEQEAYDFYTAWAKKLNKPWIREVLEDLAREEQRHKKLFIDVKKGRTLKPVSGKVVDIKISDYLVDVVPTANTDYQQALIVSMKREKAAFKLYSDLASMAPDENLRSTFITLAQEEAKHKLRLETLYDKEILTED